MSISNKKFKQTYVGFWQISVYTTGIILIKLQINNKASLILYIIEKVAFIKKKKLELKFSKKK